MYLKYGDIELDHEQVVKMENEEKSKNFIQEKINEIWIKIEKDDFWDPVWCLEYLEKIGYVTDPECYGNNYKKLIAKTDKRCKELLNDFFYNTFSYLWFPKKGNNSLEYQKFLLENGYILYRNQYILKTDQIIEKLKGDGYILDPITNEYILWNDKEARKRLHNNGYYYQPSHKRFIKFYDEKEWTILDTHLGPELRQKSLLKNSQLAYDESFNKNSNMYINNKNTGKNIGKNIGKNNDIKIQDDSIRNTEKISEIKNRESNSKNTGKNNDNIKNTGKNNNNSKNTGKNNDIRIRDNEYNKNIKINNEIDNGYNKNSRKKTEKINRKTLTIEFEKHWEVLANNIKNQEFLKEVQEPPEKLKLENDESLISPEELEEKIKVRGNREKIRESLYKLMKWKIEKYKEKIEVLTKNKNHIEQFIDKGKLTNEEIKESYPMYSTLKINLITLETLIEKLGEEMSKMEESGFVDQLLDDFLEALYNPQYGICSLQGASRENIRRLLTTQISTLINGPQSFINGFQNIVLTGPAGVGKTRLAYVISFVYTRIHVLATQNVLIVSKQDLVASYLGQTGPKTVRQLFNSLEGVILIDEAYQLSGCKGDLHSFDSYGSESIVEIMNFLDKYIGLNIVIAAGYYDKMINCFLNSNEGMPRRFPNRFHLQSFTSLDLYQLLWSFLIEKFSYFPLSLYDSLFILFVIHHLNFTLHFLTNQAGDIQNLSSFLVRRLLSPKFSISSSSLNLSVISSAFQDFLFSKEFPRSSLLLSDLISQFQSDFNLSY